MATITLLITCMAVCIPAGEQPVSLYVAIDGKDSNPGTMKAPFATLAAARDAIRARKAAGGTIGPVTVWVAQGSYVLSEPFALTAADSGTEEAPVLYRAGEGAAPVLSGAKPVTGFVAHEANILKADVSALGLPEEGPRVAVYRGKRQELARYPNRNLDDPNGGGWAYVQGERYSMYNDSPEEDNYLATHQHLDFWQRNIPRLAKTLRLRPEDLRVWSHPEEAEVSIFPRFNWSHYLVGVESLDREGGVLHLKEGSYYEIRPGDRYFVRNVFEELDSPGEWYLDRASQTLYFWPPTPLDGEPVFVAALHNVVDMEGCAHVTLRGFTIEGSNGSAVVMTDCSNCRIAGCVVRSAGDKHASGIQIDGGRGCGVVGNDISDVGYCGIDMRGGDLESLTLGGHYADNNYIHHVGLVSRDAKAIELNGCLHRVTHNLIHDTPQSGLYVWGAGHTIEYNRIRHTCLESEDTGAIGGGAIDWLSWLGVAIRYNFITDTLGYGYNVKEGRWESPYLTCGLYADWAASGLDIRGNVIVGAPISVLNLHSGRDNVIENNVLVGKGQSLVSFAGWTTDTGFWSTMVDGWIAKYDAAAQYEAWREVRGFRDPRGVPLPDGHVMYGNVVRRNILVSQHSDTFAFRFKDTPLERNESDYNVVYAEGGSIRTGRLVVKGELQPNRLSNPGFEEGAVGGLPEGWPVATAPGTGQPFRIVDDKAHEGRRSLLVEPGPLEDGGKVVKQTYLALATAPYEAGKAYRLSAWLRAGAPGVRVTLVSYSWWVSKVVQVGSEWVRHEFVFRLPEGGDPLMPPHQGAFQSYLGFPAGSGPVWVDDVSLQQVDVADEWTSWQAEGLDEHSIAGDPLFEDLEHGDYRLRPESPALPLGFEPIPVEKIGPYADALRASWPISEAPGAREALAR